LLNDAGRPESRMSKPAFFVLATTSIDLAINSLRSLPALVIWLTTSSDPRCEPNAESLVARASHTPQPPRPVRSLLAQRGNYLNAAGGTELNRFRQTCIGRCDAFWLADEEAPLTSFIDLRITSKLDILPQRG
jgi:hypothetical protein